jgi:hypothetical protein
VAARLDELLDLGHELVDHLRPPGPDGEFRSGPAQLDVAAHRVVVAADQIGGLAVAAGQVVGGEDFHDLLIGLH